MKKIMYNTFNPFLIRVPALHFNSLKEESFEMKILNPKFQEAIYIASPDLFYKLEKYLSGTITNNHEKQRIESALYRYISRMSSRCTPFGLFAGCSTGHITSDHSGIVLEHRHRHTRLDMQFLCSLSGEICKIPSIRENLMYYPNTSLYKIGNKYRYIEYVFVKSKKAHQISSIDRSFFIDSIFKISEHGAKIKDLINFLTSHQIEYNKADEFINELIDAQILVNELSPSVTGDDYFMRIIRILDNHKTNEKIISPLREIKEMLRQSDINQESRITLYKSIIKIIKDLHVPYDEKFLFQVDLSYTVTTATLGKAIIDELQSVMIFLNKITLNWKNEELQRFQQAFYERYESREVPLMEVLDTETGIGYPTNKSTRDPSPLLNNFYIPNQKSHEKVYYSNAFYPFY